MSSGTQLQPFRDARSGLCTQTFYGHFNSCNHVTFNLRGDTIASTDSDGVVKLWDVRMVAELMTINREFSTCCSLFRLNSRRA